MCVQVLEYRSRCQQLQDEHTQLISAEVSMLQILPLLQYYCSVRRDAGVSLIKTCVVFLAEDQG